MQQENTLDDVGIYAKKQDLIGLFAWKWHMSRLCEVTVVSLVAN